MKDFDLCCCSTTIAFAFAVIKPNLSSQRSATEQLLQKQLQALKRPLDRHYFANKLQRDSKSPAERQQCEICVKLRLWKGLMGRLSFIIHDELEPWPANQAATRPLTSLLSQGWRSRISPSSDTSKWKTGTVGIKTAPTIQEKRFLEGCSCCARQQNKARIFVEVMCEERN